MLNPYQRLSQFYDIDWSDFSRQYFDLIDELLHQHELVPARVLDIACGTGTLAISLAQHGHLVHGVDISPEMIAIAKSKSVGMTNLSFDIQDMVHLKVDGKFDLVTCTFDSINYIVRLNDLRKLFRRAASVLNERGLFIFDSNTRALYMSHSGETHKKELDGQSFMQYCTYDSARNLATTAFSFADGTYEIHRQRPYGYDELEPLLKHAGFDVVHLFSWFEKMPYIPNTPKLFCVAAKRMRRDS
jgi:SAM-dependent methyltransferase